MAQTPSNMIPLGTQAPDFTLKDVVSGEKKSLSELKSDRATVIMFICNHCPFVKHVLDGLLQLANDYIPRGFPLSRSTPTMWKRIPTILRRT